MTYGTSQRYNFSLPLDPAKWIGLTERNGKATAHSLAKSLMSASPTWNDSPKDSLTAFSEDDAR